MNVHQFIIKWTRAELTERSASQQHFLDLCEVFGHGKPAELDPEGDSFTFERGAAKYGGGRGWADVWKRGYFGWEYKGHHKDLAAAYDQLLRYREALENPPLLVVCDMDRIVVHTNFTGRPTVVHDIPLRKLEEPANLEIVRAVFHDPEKLKPGTTREAITQEAASRFAEIAQTLRGRGLEPHAVARFLDRIVFILFAQSVDLLQDRMVSRLLTNSREKPEVFARLVSNLFREMAEGGFFGADKIRRFDGNLFTDDSVLVPTRDELEKIYKAGRLDWSAIDPSVLGTLFERGLDPDKRSQLGAHYTSREDIETLVEPVVMQPLRREWAEVRRVVENVLATGKKEPTERDRQKVPSAGLEGAVLRKARYEADLLLRRFWERLGHLKVLDPACGSGNFLYVALQKIKDLEKEVILYAMNQGLNGFPPLVGPWQLYGIEINPYAFELAQMSVWIGYLQWIRNNGFGEPEDPVLRPMDSFECKDAILDLSDPDKPQEPDWPKVDFIVGNPPFLGGKKLRDGLGDEYVERLFDLWLGRVPAEADLCCYWFEKARAQIEKGLGQRAGLLATQGIRGGANREVLDRIKQTGDIFFAVSDRDWVLEGASVHVSMVGFDDGAEETKVLDGEVEEEIFANLGNHSSVTQAVVLRQNCGISFMGDTKGGSFEISLSEAARMLQAPNPHGLPNSDVLRPWMTGLDVTRRPRDLFIIDFKTDIPEPRAALYEGPFAAVKNRVKPDRDSNRRQVYRDYWWRHVEPRPGMRAELERLSRFLVTPTVSKFRIFAWLDSPVLPDHQLIVFARSDDSFFGVLHSRLHEVWALSQGTQVRERESGFRYIPTKTFETFPLPQPESEQESAIAAAAKELDDLRNRWLNPPEWTKEEVLEFPGSVDGPWARYIHAPDSCGIGIVRYPRRVPKDEECAGKLKQRTLTNLYNQRPTWLDLAHRKLDEAVFAAYGWDPGISDEEILEKLLALNLERAGEGEPAVEAADDAGGV
jgi:type II restriction/modification system DNA methylase subunit YeeA